MDSKKHHLLICTVGIADPVIAAIKHWTPARVLLVHSDKTRSNAEGVTKEPGLLQPGAWDMMEIHDGEDFGECVRRMRSLDAQSDAWRQKGSAESGSIR